MLDHCSSNPEFGGWNHSSGMDVLSHVEMPLCNYLNFKQWPNGRPTLFEIWSSWFRIPAKAGIFTAIKN